MTFESLKGKINILEIVRQRVPGCGTGIGKRPSPVGGQIDTGEVYYMNHHYFTSVTASLMSWADRS